MPPYKFKEEINMVVQHNITAMNSNRQLGITTGIQAKSSEKLSSGYKINRAADDAAGLSISEKMRRQIRGLTQASANAQDGISAVQTAEGALTEVHDMLQRMDELATKASNGTQSSADRNSIQMEMNQLMDEIDRVGTTTKFNELYLLNGKDNGDRAANALNSYGKSLKFRLQVGADSFNDNMISVSIHSLTARGIGLRGGDVMSVKSLVKASYEKGNATVTYNDSTTIGSQDQTTGSKVNDPTNVVSKSNAIATGDLRAADYDANEKDDTTKGARISFLVYKDTSVASSNGAQYIDRAYLSVSKQSHARGALDVINNAIQLVSRQRSQLGAVQNRLEHTIKNLDNVVENTTAAESAIRDIVMATEMVKFSKNSILKQAGHSMLAQAKQSNQSR
jgi:flagellin